MIDNAEGKRCCIVDAGAEDVLRKGFVEGKEMSCCLSIYLFILTEENILGSSVL